MAREQRHDVDYFPHPCSHGRKMHIIENKYGNDGYAVWMKLLEQLGAANDHFLDVSDEMNFMYLISVFKVDSKVAKSVLNDLAKLGAIDKNLYHNHQILYSEKFVNSVSDAYKKRKSAPLSLNEVLQKLNIQKNQSDTETPQSDTETPQSDTETPQKGINPVEVIPKEKKRKEKERKGDDEKENSPSKNLFNELPRDSFFPVETLAEKYLGDESILNAVSKTTGKSVEEIKSTMPDFCEHLKSSARATETPGEFAKYFRNILKGNFQMNTPLKTEAKEYSWKWRQQATKHGTKQQYQWDKKMMDQPGFGFKTLKSPEVCKR